MQVTRQNFLSLAQSLLVNLPDALKSAHKFVVDNIVDYEKEDFVKQMVDKYLVSLNEHVSATAVQKIRQAESHYRWTGRLYELTKDLSNKEIAKLIKKELRITFPEFKFSVTNPHNSIRVKILSVNYNPFSTFMQQNLADNVENRWSDAARYNDDFSKDYKKIEKIVGQYNYDDSDSQTDYFSVRYYDSVSLDETPMIKMFYPDNKANNSTIAMLAKWDENSKKANESAAKRRTGIKKGDKVTYEILENWGCVPAGKYEAVVLKAPNGRAMFDSFTLKITLTQVVRNKALVALKNPSTQIITAYKSQIAELKD